MTGPGDPFPGFAGRLAGIRDRIEASSPDPSTVTLMAVTKGFGPEAPRTAVAAGLTVVGENYADELVAKAHALADDPGPAPEWHYLGAIQRNKVPRLAPVVSCWQGVARVAEVYGGSVRGRTAGGRPALDVPAGISAALERAGASGVEGVDACTACAEGYFSHRARRDTVRQALLVWSGPASGRA